MAAAAAVTGCLTDVRKLSVAELPVPTASVFADLIAAMEIARPAPAGKLTKSASAVSSDASACDPTKQFTKLHGIAAKLDIQNIDTDMIISARFLKTIKRSGLGVSAFSALRYNSDGSEKPEFILNQPAYRKSSILVAGDNFGCGSSREHAPWALSDFGIRSVISTSFADIFFSNCFKNGMLPIVVSRENLDALMADADAGKTLDIDLETQSINRADGSKVTFEIDAFRKHCLLNGLDDIGLTMQKSDKIASFEKTRSTVSPWLDNASQSYLTAV
jgi:3-isopropylmalate dehydratase small subunit